jgi:hypothetical protein
LGLLGTTASLELLGELALEGCSLDEETSVELELGATEELLGVLLDETPPL